MLDDAAKPERPSLRPGEAKSVLRPLRRSGPHLPGSAPQMRDVEASGLRLVFVNGRPEPGLSGHAVEIQLRIKRVLDIIAGVLGLILLSPGFLAIALTIKINSPGPVFFRHMRTGRDGVPIRVLKFRSMHHAHCDAESRCQTLADDPRITPVGDFLRRTSLDELPQLINVVRGDMSLVGPRPHAIDMQAAGMPYRMLVQHYGMRHAVRPGITGWAQANGLRGEISAPEPARARIEHDIAYIQNFSLLLDLRILVRTIICEFIFGSGR